ncbi:uncharacterized protein J4E88_004867 [Alternaria novae-zelandiae]|uniref:uncharacterized protein n=1 Tax=Alternaria novae-zelandiae TaxID=430562 RepID=UPI0020C276F8|nr:uncharacterized protein J4E88_004867 [Alternaria novae-zelandiae]KAI4683690.1 hypothetical protein J4E88_004867 [Alternaria novae-zelandiae]
MKTEFDKIAEEAGNAELEAWAARVKAANEEIVTFVGQKLKVSVPGEFVKYLQGSYNVNLVIRFGEEDIVIVRFSKRGITAAKFLEEKVKNEVRFLEYLAEKTVIPVPRIRDWGTAKESPSQLSPYIIMDYIEGTELSELLQQLQDEHKEAEVDLVYEQIAEYMLQISRLHFSAIGPINKETSGAWTVTDRPLTTNMNNLASVVTDYPVDQFPKVAFTSTQAFLHYRADEHLLHLQVQRNLAHSHQDAEKCFIARHKFKKLIERFRPPSEADNGPFIPYCHDFRPKNMLARYEDGSLKIVAVLDFEFVNTMPAQFAYDPPWWLAMVSPGLMLERFAMEDFEALYVPRLERFLQAMARIEAKLKAGHPGEIVPLATRMRDSWTSKRFWFNYGIRKGWDVDVVYWSALHEPGDEELSGDLEKEMSLIAEKKMEQLAAYEAECDARGIAQSG